MKEPLKRALHHICPEEHEDSDAVINDSLARAKNCNGSYSCYCPVLGDITDHEWFRFKAATPNWNLHDHKAQPEYVAITFDQQVVFIKALVPIKYEPDGSPYHLVTLSNGYMYESPPAQNQGITLVCNQTLFVRYSRSNPDMFEALQHICRDVWQAEGFNTGIFGGNHGKIAWKGLKHRKPIMLFSDTKSKHKLVGKMFNDINHWRFDPAKIIASGEVAVIRCHWHVGLFPDPARHNKKKSNTAP